MRFVSFTKFRFVALAAVLVLGIYGCTRMGASKTVTLKFATGELVSKAYKQLGISVKLPQKAMDVEVWNQKWYQKEWGHKDLSFVLARAKTWPDETDFWAGTIKVFDEEQYRRWAAVGYFGHADDSQFDRVRVEGIVGESWLGWTQKCFFMNRKSSDGRVFVASLTYSEYVADGAAKDRDLKMMTNILESISFLP